VRSSDNSSPNTASDFDENDPFPRIRYPSEADTRPLVVSIPHSGTYVPEEERARYAIDIDQLRFDGDLYVDRLFANASQFGATMISTPYSRFVIDLNRLPDDVSPRAVRGVRGRTGDGYYLDRGLVWAVTTRGESIYKRPMPLRDFERRLGHYYTPYHDALARELKNLRDRFGYAILLDCHSMPSRATRAHSDPGALRPDVVPGTVDGQSCAPSLSHETENFWISLGYSVRMNHPYRGGGITRRHGKPSANIHAIQLELNRSLYMDEATLAILPNLDTLQIDCERFVATLSTLRL